MAETPSGHQPSTAVDSSSAEGPFRARLPQAQAENILASLAGRPAGPPAAVHNGHVPATPNGGPQGGAELRAQGGPRTAGSAPRPGPATAAGPQAPVGPVRPQAPAGTVRPQAPAGTVRPQAPVGPAPVKPTSAGAVGSADHAGPGGAATRPKSLDPRGGGSTGGDRGTERATGKAHPTDQNSNDILPDLPKARFRFRLR